MLSHSTDLEIGLGLYGSGDGDNSAFIALVPAGFKFCPVAKNGSPFLALGGLLLIASTDLRPFDEDASTLYG